MKLTLEVNGYPLCEMEIESNAEVDAAANAWGMLIRKFGINNYSIYKTLRPDADNQQTLSGDDGNAGSNGPVASLAPLVKVPRGLETEQRDTSEFRAERKAV